MIRLGKITYVVLVWLGFAEFSGSILAGKMAGLVLGVGEGDWLENFFGGTSA